MHARADAQRSARHRERRGHQEPSERHVHVQFLWCGRRIVHMLPQSASPDRSANEVPPRARCAGRMTNAANRSSKSDRYRSLRLQKKPSEENKRARAADIRDVLSCAIQQRGDVKYHLPAGRSTRPTDARTHTDRHARVYRHDYREPAPHAYSGPDRTCSPRFSHIRTIFARRNLI